MRGRARQHRSPPAPKSAENSAGHSRPDVAPVSVAGPPRPLSEAWITDELVAETRRVWSRHLGRIVTDEEAIEMLVNVRNAALAILRANDSGAGA
jgi:hypothetical protein